MKVTEADILFALHEKLKNKFFPLIPNSLLYRYEADLLAVSQMMFISEYEVKTSRSDFLVEKGKAKWIAFESPVKSDKIHSCANKLTYVVPKGSVKLTEINEKFGLIEWRIEKGKILLEDIRKARNIHSWTATPKMYEKLLKSACYRIWTLMEKL